MSLLFLAAISVSLMPVALRVVLSGVTFRVLRPNYDGNSSMTVDYVGVFVTSKLQCARACQATTSCMAFKVKSVPTSSKGTENKDEDSLVCRLSVGWNRESTINQMDKDIVYYELDCPSICRRNISLAAEQEFTSRETECSCGGRKLNTTGPSSTDTGPPLTTTVAETPWNQRLLMTNQTSNYNDALKTCMSLKQKATELVIRDQSQQDAVAKFVTANGKPFVKYWIGVVNTRGELPLTYYDGSNLTTFQPFTLQPSVRSMRAYVAFLDPGKWTCEWNIEALYPSLCISGGN